MDMEKYNSFLFPAASLNFACKVTSVLSDRDAVDSSPPGSSVMEFSKQEYWSGLPCPHPGDIPDPGIKPAFLMSPALADGFFTASATWEAFSIVIHNF